MILNKFIDRIEGLNLVYGPSASGKSTFAMQTSLIFAKTTKVLFFDTENSFSVNRIKLMSNNYGKLLNNIIVVRIKDFNDQFNKLNKVEELVKKGKFGYVIIDSFGNFYRYAIRNSNYKDVNEMAVLMLRSLKHVVEMGIPVLVTNQVYSGEDGEIKAIGGKMIKNFCSSIIELILQPRRMKMYKPIEKEANFLINDLGIIIM